MDDYEILNGAGLTMLLTQKNGTRLEIAELMDMKPNSVSIFWQLPQLFLITLSQVLFAISALELAYQQAPSSMKSLMMACGQLTVAFGNLIVLVFAEFRIANQVWICALLSPAMH